MSKNKDKGGLRLLLSTVFLGKKEQNPRVSLSQQDLDM